MSPKFMNPILKRSVLNDNDNNETFGKCSNYLLSLWLKRIFLL